MLNVLTLRCLMPHTAVLRRSDCFVTVFENGFLTPRSCLNESGSFVSLIFGICRVFDAFQNHLRHINFKISLTAARTNISEAGPYAIEISNIDLSRL